MQSPDKIQNQRLQRVMQLLKPLMAETIGNEFEKMPERELVRLEDELLLETEKFPDPATPLHRLANYLWMQVFGIRLRNLCRQCARRLK